MLTYIEDPEDIQWLLETALRSTELGEFRQFQAAILQGSEDCPDTIHIYLTPDVNSRFLALKFDGDRYGRVYNL